MAGKLVKCKTCGEDIARNAKVCPHCGARNKHRHPIVGAILIFFAIGIIGSSLNGMSSKDNVSLEEFDVLYTGMSYEQAVETIGFEGSLNSQVDIGAGQEYKMEIYTWPNPNGSNMNATFQGGKLISKSQIGLK